MSSNIVFPTLSKWAEERITALFTTTDEESFNGLYNATFAKDAKITVNGKHLSGEAYKKQLLASKVIETGAQVAYSGAVEVPEDAGRPAQVRALPHHCISLGSILTTDTVPLGW